MEEIVAVVAVVVVVDKRQSEAALYFEYQTGLGHNKEAALVASAEDFVVHIAVVDWNEYLAVVAYVEQLHTQRYIAEVLRRMAP